ncbi:centrosomal protein of 170 kDa protein B isoform X2 [Gouania willdenowi]|uniref:centrosomal protein of 170 kDa protein B isoform X2 n=1 Tax=Gouania willdenowi TaxID=441366 RepID=UPI001054DE9E|nr:centrosomal protein of 170 kDa protein B isoform X2 [Gouania willdenowi]
MSVTSWFLVSSSGTRHRLPREMIFVGRDECELMLQSRSVDKQHAVINYVTNTDEHMVKDLGSLNGTFVNDLRIPEQTYITLKLSDVIRFGYDAHVYILEKNQHNVPEEALKHEKYTSQLQISIKALEAKAKEKQQFQSSAKTKDFFSNVKAQEKERRAQSLTAATDTPISKPSPLYGQPSWWGDDEDSVKKQARGRKLESPELGKDSSRYESGGSLSENQAKSIFYYRREPSYFEIPTKEFQQQIAKKPEVQVYEIPTKDTSDPQCPPTTPPVVQSHASFTIEFDDCTPGKMKIKDHVTKFSVRQQRHQTTSEVPSTPTEVMSAASKVADWLSHSNTSTMTNGSQGEDLCSTNGDSFLKNRNENYIEDGSHTDFGNLSINGKDYQLAEHQTLAHVSPQILQSSPLKRLTDFSGEPSSYSLPGSQSQTFGKGEPHQAFVIEFLDDNPRKKRSQSFTNSSSPPEPSSLDPQQGTAKKCSGQIGEKHIPSTACATPPTQRYTIPLKSPASTGPQRAGSLRREKTEEHLGTECSSSSVPTRHFSSVGRRSKLAQEFTAEFLKQAKHNLAASWGKNTSQKAIKPGPVLVQQYDQRSTSPPQSTHYQPQTSSPINQPVPLKTPAMSPGAQNMKVKSPQGNGQNEEDDTLSDAGTYTIEADIQDKDLEEARNKIDLVSSVGTELQGAPKWMSCWASLVDSYTESGPSSDLFDITSQMELSGAATPGIINHNAALECSHDISEFDGSRTCHSLMQVPPRDKCDLPPPSTHVHYDLQSTFDLEDNSLDSKESLNNLAVQNDVEPDSLSDASKSDDGSIIEHRKAPLSDADKKLNEDDPNILSKTTTFYIESDEPSSNSEFKDTISSSPNAERKRVAKTFSNATLTKLKGTEKVKFTVSEPVRSHETQSTEVRERTVSPLIRQESFTKERPSSARLPHISSNTDFELFKGVSSHDTHSYLKETEDVLASLEAKLQSGHSESTPSPVMDSLSGESDMDTSSTVSQNSNKTKPNTLLNKTFVSGFHRERSSASIASQDLYSKSTSSEKSLSRSGVGTNNSVSTRRPLGLRRSTGKFSSTDLSDEPHSLHYSDQESSNHPVSQKYTVPLQKEDGKTSRVSKPLGRTNSLTAPRPTRASMLRRARLGEASDNEGAETERLTQESVNSQTRQPQEGKKLSRLDMLAMPRKRTGSFNNTSDTETGRTTGPSSLTRRASASGPKPAERPQKAALTKTPVTRVRSCFAKYASSTASSRRHQKGSDYTSTSDEEYDSNQSTPKQKRSQTSSASHSPRHQPRSQPMVALQNKYRRQDSEEEKQEGEATQSWSTHSVEIARLSQDLAKDLAILAKEIHDVAGDGDLQNPEVGCSEPVSAVTAHEHLVHIQDAGTNYQRPPPTCASPEDPDQRSLDNKQNSRKAHNRDEDMIMLNPVSKIIVVISNNTEQLADKIKVLFQDRLDIWEQIEAKLDFENDVPQDTTCNKEVASILKELRRVQKQLEVINSVIEPSNHLEAARTSSSGASTLRSSPSGDWRTVHSVSRRGGGPRPSESVRRAAVTPDDIRQGYLV